MQIENLPTIQLADKAIIYYDDYARTYIYFPFYQIGFKESKLHEGYGLTAITHTVILLSDTLKYIEPYNNSTDSYKLTDLGRQVKNAGGHFAYLKKLEIKELADHKRQERKDQADELDLKIKKWQIKTKYLPYIVSIFALAVSIFSYFKPEKKQLDLQQVQQDLQQLKDHVKSQDSLLRVDTFLKKHK
jgi:hypothetical protein